MKYEFHPAALQEYAEAVEFFAQQDKQQRFHRHDRKRYISSYWRTRTLADR